MKDSHRFQKIGVSSLRNIPGNWESLLSSMNLLLQINTKRFPSTLTNPTHTHDSIFLEFRREEGEPATYIHVKREELKAKLVERQPVPTSSPSSHLLLLFCMIMSVFV